MPAAPNGWLHCIDPFAATRGVISIAGCDKEYVQLMLLRFVSLRAGGHGAFYSHFMLHFWQYIDYGFRHRNLKLPAYIRTLLELKWQHNILS